jgi:hypothetical protein
MRTAYIFLFTGELTTGSKLTNKISFVVSGLQSSGLLAGELQLRDAVCDDKPGVRSEHPGSGLHLSTCLLQAPVSQCLQVSLRPTSFYLSSTGFSQPVSTSEFKAYVFLPVFYRLQSASVYK